MSIKQLAVFSMVLTLLVTGCSGAGTPASAATAATTPTSVPASDPVFKTPEEAITYYFEGLQQSDVQKILAACAINEMSEKYKFAGYVDRLGGVIQPSFAQAPTDYPLYVEANKLQLSAQILNRVKMFAYGLLSAEKIDDSTSLLKLDGSKATDFVKAVDPGRLAKLEVKQIVPANKRLMSDAKYLANAAKVANIYGADESTERVVLFSFDQTDYLLGFTLLRYGDSWKINTQTSALAGTSVMGLPQPTTAQEFENLTNK
jgi:hypothetical protein